MISRGMLARIKAKAGMVFASKVPVEDQQCIAMKDLVTGEIVQKFVSIDEAVEKGFSKPHVAGALKNGNKYKGHLWERM
jgi:hypothetical protein